MIRLVVWMAVIGMFASCERTNRNIEIQPNDNLKPENNSDDADSEEFIFTTGSLKLRVSGLPQSAGSAALKISISGNSETRNVSLVDGKGITTITDLTPGELDVDVSATIGSATYRGATEISVFKGMISSASIVMSTSSTPTPTPNPDPQPTPMPQPEPQQPQPQQPQPQQPQPQQPQPQQPQPQQPQPQQPQPQQPQPQQPTPNNNNGGGRDSSLDIGIDIGRNNSNQPQVNPPQSAWDGRSFQGNNMFSIEPID